MTIKKLVLFISSIILIVLLVSFPSCSPLLLIIFSIVFELIHGEKVVKQYFLLFLMLFFVTIITFCNHFFISQYRLLLLAALFFAVLLAFDFIIIFQLMRRRDYALPLIFLYVIISRFIISLSPAIFPFYWTLTVQLLPFMNIVSQFLLPIFFEGICIVIAVAIYLFFTKKLIRKLLVQIIGIIFIGITLSLTIKFKFASYSIPNADFECTIIQGGYSLNDYTFIERYPILSKKIVQGYLTYTEDVTNVRFIILPESAFPIEQNKDSQVLQILKDIAFSKNTYILTSVLLNENNEVYNSVALINPQGQIQDIYKKKNVVLFVENSRFAKGKTAQTFSVDNYTVAPLICFDSVFIRNYFRDKIPDIYIVTSNDVFAEGTVLSQLHQAYSIINARTMGISLLQIVQNGPSFYINSKGILINLTRPYEKAVSVSVKIY
jgi:apolipoprotein N-acyltransferase